MELYIAGLVGMELLGVGTYGEKVIISWSGGKDSALALYRIMRDDAVEIVDLLTVITEGYDRVSMHGVRRSLVKK